MSTVRTIETKVLAAAAGGGVGGAVGAFILWLLGVLVWHQSSAAVDAPTAVAAVPPPVSELLLVLLAAGFAALGGYLAPHTPRPDLAVIPASDVVAQVSPAGHLVAGPASTLETGTVVNLAAPTWALTVPNPVAWTGAEPAVEPVPLVATNV
jgi:hypothetical protein